MTNPAVPPVSPPPVPEDPHARWKFLRDVAVFQFKLFLDNLRDFALVPVSLIAAVIDVVIKGEREGERFYKVLEWGWHSERMIDLYSCIEADESAPLGHGYTVDAVLRQVEGVIVREYERGGTTATVRAAVDAVLDTLQREGGERAKDAMARAAEKLRSKMGADDQAPK